MSLPDLVTTLMTAPPARPYSAVKSLVTTRKPQGVYLQADTRVPYGQVVRVIPPLVTTAAEVDMALEILDDSLAAAGA